MPNKDCQSKRAREMFPVIESFHSSHLTQKSFCEAEGLALSTLQYWISRYKACPEQSRRKHRLRRVQLPQQDTAPSPKRFVELKPQVQAATAERRDGTIVIGYPNGVTLSLSPPTNLELLKELINL
jgi:hypothetical protein